MTEPSSYDDTADVRAALGTLLVDEPAMPWSVADDVDRGRALRRRRRTRVGSLAGLAAAAVLVIGVAGPFDPGSTPTPSTGSPSATTTLGTASDVASQLATVGWTVDDVSEARVPEGGATITTYAVHQAGARAITASLTVRVFGPSGWTGTPANREGGAMADCTSDTCAPVQSRAYDCAEPLTCPDDYSTTVTGARTLLGATLPVRSSIVSLVYPDGRVVEGVATPIQCATCMVADQPSFLTVDELRDVLRVVPSATSTPTPDPSASLDVTAMVGNWFVSGPGIEDGLTATVSAGGVMFWPRCGHVDGGWRASADGVFLGMSGGIRPECLSELSLGWWESAVRWQVDGDGWLLRDASGRVVARFAPGASPTPDAGIIPEAASPPVLTAEDRARMVATPAPTEGLRPATREELLGSWVPVTSAGREPNPRAGLTVADDRTWTGSDGCNGGGGRWQLAGLRLLTMGGAITQVGCNNIGVPAWFGEAVAASFDGGTLVLFDYRGVELGRLVRP